MPLSEPADRTPVHTRRVTCRGFRRTDGLWDIEGHLVDTKTYRFASLDRGEVGPGEPIHEMWLRLTVDDDFTVRAVEAVTDASPFTICGEVAPNFQRLVGLGIGAGWRRAVRERLGGTEGCTHLVELLGPMATTAFQTMFPILSRERAGGGGDGMTNETPDGSRPKLLDSCHAFASDGPVVARRWPAFYSGKTPPDKV